MRFYKNVYSEINLDNLVHNLNIIRDINPDHKVIAVVKDDAYGHGAVDVSKKLIECGVEMLAVGYIGEALELRRCGISESILIMGITPLDYLDELLDYGLTQTITSFEYAILLSDALSIRKRKLKVHLKIETGMGRVGLFASDENFKIVNNIYRNPFFEVEGIYTHLSNSDNPSDDYTFKQYELFKSFCNSLDRLKLNINYRHICNSSGILNFKFNDMNCVRPGLLLYGYGNNTSFNDSFKFKSVMKLKASIVHIKNVSKGEFIGYSKSYKVDREKVVATINVGYGHGYPRYLSNKGIVILKGKYCRVIGNICMDHFMVDITEVEGVKLFDSVTLMGEDSRKKINADDIAHIGGTICYEFLCGIRRKVPRVYVSGGNVVNIRECMV